jgi:hypothetical protein
VNLFGSSVVSCRPDRASRRAARITPAVAGSGPLLPDCDLEASSSSPLLRFPGGLNSADGLMGSGVGEGPFSVVYRALGVTTTVTSQSKVLRVHWRWLRSARLALSACTRVVVPPLLTRAPARPADGVDHFITFHNGFTLNDLISYYSTPNLTKTQGNQDGTDDNRSWNCGSGAADDGPGAGAGVLILRRRHQRVCLHSASVPGRARAPWRRRRNGTQQQLEHPYCSENATSWFRLDGRSGGRQLHPPRRQADVAPSSGRLSTGTPRLPDPAPGESGERAPRPVCKGLTSTATGRAAVTAATPGGHVFSGPFAATGAPATGPAAWTLTVDTIQENESLAWPHIPRLGGDNQCRTPVSPDDHR